MAQDRVERSIPREAAEPADAVPVAGFGAAQRHTAAAHAAIPVSQENPKGPRLGFLEILFGACLAGGVLGFGFWAWRGRKLARSRERMHERLLERSRIARELHDTLLQDVLGLSLQLHTLSDRLDKCDPVRAGLEGAVGRIERVVAEGRDRIAGLRMSGARAGDLEDALEAAAEEFVDQAGARMMVRVAGQCRALDAAVFDEIYHLCREAMANAAQHAAASLVMVEVCYSREVLKVRVQDNGRGIDAKVLMNRGAPGHWGLVSMRERAARVNGQLVVRRGALHGTLVQVTVPARYAYRAPPMRAHVKAMLKRWLNRGQVQLPLAIDRRFQPASWKGQPRDR